MMDAAENKKPQVLGKPFAKGNRANPRGAGALSKLDRELKGIRRLTKAELAEIGSLLLYSNKAEIEKLAKDTKVPMIKSMMAAMIVQGHKNPIAFEKVLDRIVGKVKDKIEVSTPGMAGNRYAALSQEELEKKRLENARTIELLSTPPLDLDG